MAYERLVGIVGLDDINKNIIKLYILILMILELLSFAIKKSSERLE